MKKVYLLAFLFVCAFGNAQMATSGKQDVIIDVLRNTYNLIQASPSSTASATTRTITSSIVTSSATISAGSRSLGFLTSSNFTGLINGVSYPADMYIEFHAPNYDILPAVTYTVTTGSITINQIR